MKQRLSFIGLLLVIILTVVLSLANRQEVIVHYLFGQFRFGKPSIQYLFVLNVA